jgi:hypothetical protein
MILFIGLVIIELSLLYVLARRFTQSLFLTSFRVTKSRSVSVTILTLFLFPGTVVHELSHLFTAEILGIRTGKLTLVPESIKGQDITTGSVAISHSDPFRRALIGIAPLFNGSIILGIIAYFLPTWIDGFISAPSLSAGIPLIGALYGVLTVSTTMFSSPEDMKGVIPVGILFLLVFVGGYFAGVEIHLPDPWNMKIAEGMIALAKALGIVLGIHLAVIIATGLPGIIFQKK